MAPRVSVDDKEWPEVEGINNYAMFMGYLSVGVRGLGLLVLTWTTVVLLGGFVSILQKKDFWCLTVITLVQISGVFDFLVEEKANHIGNSVKGLLAALNVTAIRPFRKDKRTNASKAKQDKDPSVARTVLIAVLWLAQLLVLALVLCLVAVLYVFGLYISAGMSFWRLVEQDYGNAEGGANLRPALNVLYSLAVAQGVVFSYKTIYDSVSKAGLVEKVASHYPLDKALVSDYLEETVTGCMKDPSFAIGRNLITYSVDSLMECKSTYDYLSGVRILGTILHDEDWYTATFLFYLSGQSSLTKKLLTGSSSFSQVVRRLLETFGPTSPYSTEIREHAARIVATVAGSIRLEQFPGGMIQCVSSLLDTFEEYSWRPEGYDRDTNLSREYERDWLLKKKRIRRRRPGVADRETQEIDSGSLLKGYNGLVVQGLRILQKLAIDEDNCRVISNTPGLLSKAMGPLISDQLHRDGSHDAWSSIAAEESIELMKQFMATPGEVEANLQSEISGNRQAIIITLKAILECHRCEVLLKRQATEVLLDLSVHTPSVMSGSGGGSRILLIWTLLHILLLPDNVFDRMCGSIHLAKKSSYVTRLADKKLQDMLSSQTEANNATNLLRSVCDVIGSLTRALVDAENNAHRLHVAKILRDLCRYYTKEDEYLDELKKQIADVMQEVVKEIVGCGSTSEESQASTEANHVQDSALGTDLENGGASDGHVQENASSSQQQNDEQEGRKLREALISLCYVIDYVWVYEDQDLTRRFNEITANICSEQGIYAYYQDFQFTCDSGSS